jgi:hypothetical protein
MSAQTALTLNLPSPGINRAGSVGQVCLNAVKNVRPQTFVKICRRWSRGITGDLLAARAAVCVDFRGNQSIKLLIFCGWQ